MLEITLANDFTVTEHAQDLTAKSAQTLYALRVLPAHGLSDAALQEVYRSVVVARLLYAASAWHGFTKPADRRLTVGTCKTLRLLYARFANFLRTLLHRR